MSALGLDIGGANLKASDGERSLSVAFPIWQRSQDLATEISAVLSQFHPYGPIAATMTGELADCFETRASGVRFILDALQSAAGSRQVFLWQTAGEFVSIADAYEFPILVAAANWHALATWAGRACPAGNAVLIDVGSTTTDIIPIEQGFPSSLGVTDLERLKSGELIYTGTRRTPVPMLTDQVILDGESCPLAAELFATTLDVGLLLNDIPEDDQDTQTANGQPSTRSHALNRLARCLCSDLDELTDSHLVDMARQIQHRQLALLSQCLIKVIERLGSVDTIVMSGEGEWLAAKLLQTQSRELAAVERLSLNGILGPLHSQAACAWSLAKLCSERL